MIFLFLTLIYCKIFDINEKEFNFIIKDLKYFLIYFYGINCELCHNFNLELEDVSFFFDELNIFTINCTENINLCRRYSIISYPSIKFINLKKQFHKLFLEKFSSSNLISFIEKNTKLKSNYIFKEPKIINYFNFNTFINSNECILLSYFTNNSIKSLPFFPVIRNISRVYNFENNISFGYINCDISPEICTFLNENDLPVFYLYKNNSKIIINQETMLSTINSINSFCNLNRNLNGYPFYQSCLNYFKNPTINSNFYCKKIFQRYKKGGIKLLKKDLNLLNKVLNDKKCSFNNLDNSYLLKKSIEEFLF